MPASKMNTNESEKDFLLRSIRDLAGRLNDPKVSPDEKLRHMADYARLGKRLRIIAPDTDPTDLETVLGEGGGRGREKPPKGKKALSPEEKAFAKPTPDETKALQNLRAQGVKPGQELPPDFQPVPASTQNVGTSAQVPTSQMTAEAPPMTSMENLPTPSDQMTAEAPPLAPQGTQEQPQATQADDSLNGPTTPATKLPDMGPSDGSQVANALHDTTPLEGGNEQADLVKRLTQAILAPQAALPLPRPFTPGEHIALGIIGALDPEAFKSVIMPLLEQERMLPRQAALDAEGQRQRQTQALESLARIQETQANRAREHEQFQETQARLNAQETEHKREFTLLNERQQAEFAEQLQQRRELTLLKLAPKLDSKDRADIRIAKATQDLAGQALDWIQKHPGKISMSPVFLSKVDPEVAALDGILGKLRTNFVIGQGGKRITDPELRIMQGNVPMRGITHTETEAKGAIQSIMNWAVQKQSLIEGDFGQPLDVLTEAAGMSNRVSKQVPLATLNPGEERQRLHIPDEELP